MAVINQKGGVGKTTTTANLGAALAERGQRVLLVDLDPQSHLTTHLGLNSEELAGTYELLTESTPVADMLRAVERGMKAIPACMDLAAAESELISVVGREVILRDRLRELDDAYDWLLIDCPPSFSVLTLNALVAVEEIIVPLQAHFLALQGVGKLLETVSLVAQRINPGLKVTGFVLCMYEGGTKLAAEVIDDLQRFLAQARGQNVAWREARVFDARIRRNIKLAECPSYGQSIFAYAPKSHGAIDYLALADELVAAAASSSVASGSEAATAPDAEAAEAPAIARIESSVTSAAPVRAQAAG